MLYKQLILKYDVHEIVEVVKKLKLTNPDWDKIDERVRTKKIQDEFERKAKHGISI